MSHPGRAAIWGGSAGSGGAGRVQGTLGSAGVAGGYGNSGCVPSTRPETGQGRGGDGGAHVSVVVAGGDGLEWVHGVRRLGMHR